MKTRIALLGILTLGIVALALSLSTSGARAAPALQQATVPPGQAGITIFVTPTPTAVPPTAVSPAAGGGGPAATGVPCGDMTISKSASLTRVKVGDVLQYTISITNPPCATSLTNVIVTDTVPSQLDFLRANVSQGTSNYDAPSRVLTFNVGNIAPGVPVSLAFQATVNNSAQVTDTISNTAVMSVNGAQRATAAAGAVQIIPAVFPVTGFDGDD